MIKESIHQEDKTVNIYASNIRAFKYKENTIKELKEKYLSTQWLLTSYSLLWIDYPDRESIRKQWIWAAL